MNKRGLTAVIWVFIFLGVLLVLAFASALILASVKWTSNTVTPMLEDFGVVEGANLSSAGEQTFGVLDTIINVLPLLVGFGYFILLAGCIFLVMSYRTTANPVFIGLFFAFMIALIFTSILVSNSYEDIYNSNDVIATELQGMTILSFLILNSPILFTAVAFISGIFLFGGKQNEAQFY